MTSEWNPEPEELMNQLMGRVFEKLTQGDGDFLEDRRGFFSWATPGIPIEDDQFDFMDGFTGADEAARARKFAKARDFANFVDFVPRPDGTLDAEAQVSVFDNGIGRLSDEYERVLRMSQVTDNELTEEQEEKLEKFRGLLRSTTTETDIITDEKTTVTTDSELIKTYNEKMAAYEAAALEYNNLRIDALSGTVDGANARFAVNGSVLKHKVRAALDAWESVGHRSDVERITAYIAQVTGRSMVLHKRNLIDVFDSSQLTDPSSNLAFNYTSLAPAGVLRSTGWTRFEFTSAHRSSSESTTTSSFDVGGKMSFGFGLKLGGEGGRDEKQIKKTLDTSDFSFAFEMTESVISRAWMDMAFLLSRGWRFAEDGELLSDGEVPPAAGTMPAYPTTMILVRNLELQLAELSDESSEFTKSLRAKGNVGWGPFALKGSYQRGSTKVTREVDQEGQKIKVAGPQVIGFRCNLLSPAQGVPVPNPDPDVEESAWV